jgi:hypothetical protein
VLEPKHPRWRWTRRILLALAALGTVIAVFYTVENWRGKRAWEKYRRAAEAKGQNLDWNACIPAPVPDDQNIFKAPKMEEWFVKQSGSAAPKISTQAFAVARDKGAKDLPVLVAEVEVVPSSPRAGNKQAEATLRLDDPAASERLQKLLGDAVGPCVEGAQGCVIVAQPLDQIKPARLVVEASPAPTLKEITTFLVGGPLVKGLFTSSDITYLKVAAAGSNAFRVSLAAPVYSAADYLAWSQPLVANFDLLRKALERPYARMDGDYQRPYEIAVPNFVQTRVVAQTLAQRAQSYLLLGQPEAAWHDLALIHDMCRLLEGSPTGKPMTLVAAMINVAVTGLYVQIIQDGLRLEAWREPQLAAIQSQLKQVNLLPHVSAAFFCEQLATCHTLETSTAGELAKLFSPGDPRASFWQRIQDPTRLIIAAAPRGWFYQNMIADSLLDQSLVEAIDLTNCLIRPSGVEQFFKVRETLLGHASPYNFLARLALPNFVRATQTLARNQSLANEALIACALERCRLTQGQYPDSLEALVPRFIDALPHDLVNGEPLKYRRDERSGYLLYSVGWNEKDDGGVAGRQTAEGDWVWPSHPRG